MKAQNEAGRAEECFPVETAFGESWLILPGPLCEPAEKPIRQAERTAAIAAI